MASGNPFGREASGNPFAGADAGDGDTGAGGAGSGAAAPAPAPAPAPAAAIGKPGNPFADVAPPRHARAASGGAGRRSAAAAAGEDGDGPPAESKIGPLRKLGEKPNALGRPSIKLRFVAIRDGRLTYHKSERDAQVGTKPVKGNVLVLREFEIARSIRPDPYGIILRPARSGEDRRWYFVAASAEDRDDWVYHMVAHGCYDAGYQNWEK